MSEKREDEQPASTAVPATALSTLSRRIDVTQSSPTTKTLEIKIVLPVIPAKLRHLSLWEKLFDMRAYESSKAATIKIPRTYIRIGGAVCAIALVSLGSYYFKSHDGAVSSDASASNTTPKLVRGVPEFDTVLPAGKKIEDLGGWVRISPPNRNPVFTYTDRIGNASVNVSQQPLPENFKLDPAKSIDQLAVSFLANEKITVGDTAAHIGTSAEGPQSVILTKDDLLILIKSSARIDNDSWTRYISSLK